MLASELLKVVKNIINEHGDVKVKTFDLDRDECDITEISYNKNNLESSIYIG